MQHEITVPGNVLTMDGKVREAGYSTHSVLHYNRESIKAAPWRIKEWDWYQVGNDRFCIQLTIGHVSYLGSIAVTLLDLEKGQRQTIMKPLILPFNRLQLPCSAEEGVTSYKAKGFEMSFKVEDKARKLVCKIDDPRMIPVEMDVTLSQPDKSALVIATPYKEDPHAFYYNHKIN